MNNVLIRFENFNDDKLKGEIKKWCRKLEMPLKRRAVRLFFEDEPKRNKHLLGGSFFCDFALMDRLMLGAAQAWKRFGNKGFASIMFDLVDKDESMEVLCDKCISE